MLHGGLRSPVLFAGEKGSNIADRGEGQLWHAYATLQGGYFQGENMDVLDEEE